MEPHRVDAINETESATERHYRTACDKVIGRVGSVMQSIIDASKVRDGLEDKYGDILCDLAEIQGFLYRVCAAGVNTNKDRYLEFIIEDHKEISQ
jgi:hypothetical protein